MPRPCSICQFDFAMRARSKTTEACCNAVCPRDIFLSLFRWVILCTTTCSWCSSSRWAGSRTRRRRQSTAPSKVWRVRVCNYPSRDKPPDKSVQFLPLSPLLFFASLSHKNKQQQLLGNFLGDLHPFLPLTSLSCSSRACGLGGLLRERRRRDNNRL